MSCLHCLKNDRLMKKICSISSNNVLVLLVLICGYCFDISAQSIDCDHTIEGKVIDLSLIHI